MELPAPFRGAIQRALARPLALLWIAALAGSPALAGHLAFLLSNEIICADDERVCVRATLTHHNLSNRFEVVGRVQRTVVPGVLVFRMRGITTAGFREYADLRVAIRGRYSEIVNHRMIPDAPSQTQWQLDALTFEAAE